MDSKTRTFLLSALGGIALSIAGLIAYITNIPPTDPVPVAGSGGVASAGKGGVSAGGKGGVVAVAGSVAPPVVVPPVGGFANPVKTLGTNAWFSVPGGSWTGEAIFKAGTTFADVGTNYASKINPQYVADLKAYGGRVFRAMDSQSSNFSTVSKWSQRTLPTAAKQEGYGAADASSHGDGIALEYLIALANTAGVDLWVNMPAQADDDYAFQLATLLKAQLRSDLRVYAEYSNENNLGQWGGTQWLYKQGPALGLPGMNQYYQATSLSVKRTLDMSAQFAKVFGADAIGTRVLVVVSATGNLDLTAQALKSVYASNAWNVNGANKGISMFACAPYLNSTGNDGTKFDLATVKKQIDGLVSGEPIANVNAWAKTYGVPYTGIYEWSSSDFTAASTSAMNAGMQDAYNYALAKYSAALNGALTHYTLHSEYSSNNAWGATSSTGADCSKFPKCRALSAWLTAH